MDRERREAVPADLRQIEGVVEPCSLHSLHVVPEAQLAEQLPY